MEFYIVDAFADTAFGGNPAGVVLCSEKPDPEIMQKIAAEVRFSETAFVSQLDEKNFNVRFFTPAAEVELCGHATVSAFQVLKENNIVKTGSKYTMKALAGDLTIYINENSIMMEQASPKQRDTEIDLEKLSAVLGIQIEDLGDRNHNLEPKITYTGIWDIMLPVKDNNVLNKISPDFEKLSKLSARYDVCGLHAFTLDTNYAASCRNFAPLFGIDEEAATGTSNGALSYYLYLRDIISLDKDNVFLQGEKMNRPSLITTRLQVQEDNLRVLVGGTGKILLKGNLYL